MGLTRRLLRPIQPKLDALEVALEQALDSDVPIISEMNGHIAKQAGKRVRPTLLLLCARMAGYEGEGDVTLGAAVEFIHTATLIHDDIIDEAETRRGQSSVNAVWGSNHSVLLGDYLYTMALGLALEERELRVLDVLTEATRILTEGELMEVAATGDLDLSQQAYLDIIGRKTAALFAASCRLAGLLARLDGEREAALERYGLNVGMAFQLVDDLLDFVGDAKELGKPVVNDLTEGKLTLPVILLLERSRGSETDLVRRIVAQRRASSQEQQALLELLKRYGTLKATRQLAADYGRRALKGLAPFEDSATRCILEKIPELLLSRTR